MKKSREGHGKVMEFDGACSMETQLTAKFLMNNTLLCDDLLAVQQYCSTNLQFWISVQPYSSWRNNRII